MQLRERVALQMVCTLCRDMSYKLRDRPIRIFCLVETHQSVIYDNGDSRLTLSVKVKTVSTWHMPCNSGIVKHGLFLEWREVNTVVNLEMDLPS